MKYKKWVISLVSVVLVACIIFGSIMVYLDPLVQFGNESSFLTYYEYSEMYSNPGIAKNYTYDTVLVGTSMVENTDVNLCNKLLNCNMVRLPYSGGTTFNMRTILDVCFKSKNDIKTVYWELDEFQLTGSATEPRYPLPEYLYTDKITDKLSYILNLDIFYHYGVNSILGTLRGQNQKAARTGIELHGEYGKKNVLNSFSKEEKSDKTYTFEEMFKNKVDENLSNITTLVKQHPNTEFVFFMVPFSVLYWYNEIQKGIFDASMDGVIYALNELLKYDNVRIYNYQFDEKIMSNLDNYKDYSHYKPEINDKITEYISRNEKLVTKENYILYVEELREYIHSYDFSKVFSE